MDDKVSRWDLLAVLLGLAALTGSILWTRSPGSDQPEAEGDQPDSPLEMPLSRPEEDVSNEEADEARFPTTAVLGRLIGVFSPEGILVPSVILGALAYFLGWRYLFSYYASFGLDTTLFSFSPTEVIAAGWRIFLMVAVLLLLGAGIMVLCNRLSEYLMGHEKLGNLLVVFFVLSVVALLGSAYVVYQFIFVWGAHAFLRFYLWAFGSLLVLWAALVVGINISKAAKSREGQDGLLGAAFRMVFLNPYLWLGILAVALTVTLAWFSSWSALESSRRDRTDESRLPIAAFQVSAELGIPNGVQVHDGVWLYEDLRLLLKNEDTYFAFRIEEAENDVATLYAIPQDHVVQIQLRNWYYNVANP